MKNNIITGIDIGTFSIKIVSGQINSEGNLNIVSAVDVPTSGVSKGIVVSIDDVISSITSGLEQAERIIGQPISRAYVGISGSHITTMQSRGVVAVSRADNEVSESDIGRVIEAAQTVATPPNYEILHIIPKIFTVDNQTGIKNPVGMTGIRLECEVQIIQGLSSQIKNLTKAIYRTGVNIDDLVLGVLANAESCVSKKQKELGSVLINIGHSTTSIAVFEEGDVVATHILPIGSSHITNDIALGLRTSLDVAEDIKLTYGQASPDKINSKEEIEMSEFDAKDDTHVALKHVAEIIEARLAEIFDMVDAKLNEIDRSGMLPAGAILTGGGAKIPGVVDLAKKELRLPASLGMPKEIKTVIDKVNDLKFSLAVGLIIWGYEIEKQRGHGGGINFSFDFSKIKNIFKVESVRGLGGKIKKLFKSLIP